MFFREKKIIGVDFNDYYAEVVEISNKKHGMELEAYGRIVIPSEVIVGGEIMKVEELKELLKELFSNASPHPITEKDVAVVLPSNKILTHLFRFPAALKENEIASALPYEIEKVIPFPIEDIYYDFTVLEAEDVVKFHATQNVLFSCVEKKVADQYLNIFKSLKMMPHLFGVVPEALKFALRSQVMVQEAVMVIEVDTLSTNYLLVEKGVIKHFFSSNSGGRKLVTQLAEASGVTEDEIIKNKNERKLSDPEQLKMIHSFYNALYERGSAIIKDQIASNTIKNVNRILLTGKFLDVDEAHLLGKQAFNGITVEVGDPKIGLTIALNEDDSMLVKNMPVAPYSIFFVHSVGVATRALSPDCSLGINLLPTTLKQMFLNKRKVVKMAVASVAMTIISLVIAGLLLVEYQQLIFVRASLEIEKSSMEKLLYGVRYQDIRDDIVEFNKEVDALANIDRALFSVPTMLKELEAMVPKDIKITAISYNDEDLRVDINGIAATRDRLLQLQRDFESADFVESVIAPISNYDEKKEISFLFQLKLNFSKLQPYGYSARNK